MNELLTALDRYMDSQCSKEEETIVRSWLTDNIADPCYDKIFERLLDNSAPDDDLESLRRSERYLDIFIDREETHRKKLQKTKRMFGWFGATAAAAVLAVFLMVLKPKEPVQWYEAYAKRGETERIMLPDGTSLWLNSDTKVLYPSRFDSETRTIYIDGEIFADVTTDRKKPFIVSASGMNVKVHGTQFGVKAFAERDNIEVALISGSVSIEDTDDKNGFSRVLVPGDLIRYNKTFGTVEDYRINTATYGAWQNNHNIRFINQSLKDIAEDLERHFDVEILIEDDTLAKTQYYASFIHNEGLEKILKALNSNDTMIISKKHDTIVISPNN